MNIKLAKLSGTILCFMLALTLCGYSVQGQAADNGLLAALRCGNVKEVRRLLAANADINARDNTGFTVLHAAVLLEDEDIVKLLIAKGANVNVKSDDGDTPLHVAARSEDIDMISLLIAKGADVNARNKKGVTPSDIREDIERSIRKAQEVR